MESLKWRVENEIDNILAVSFSSALLRILWCIPVTCEIPFVKFLHLFHYDEYIIKVCIYLGMASASGVLTKS